MNPAIYADTQAAREANHLRVLYLGYYMALGAFLPYITLFYKNSGLSGVEIGSLIAMILTTTSLTAIPWGMIADRYRLHRPILSGAFLVAASFVLLLSRVSTYARIVPLAIGHALFVTPIVPLLDSSAVAVAGTGKVTFGQIRVGGTIGWILSVWLVGLLVQSFGLRWLFYAYVTFMGLTFLYTLFRPPRRANISVELGRNLRALVSDRAVLFFFVSIFIVALANGAVQNFLSLYLDGIGAGADIIGIAWAVAAVSEIPIMMVSGRLMRWIGSSGLLMLAFLLFAVRWLLFSFVHDPLWAVAVQFLHGLCFAAFLTAGVTYLHEHTPEGVGTTAQAIFNMISFGLAGIAGSLAGGYLYDHGSMALFFRTFSAVTAIGLILFWTTSARPWRVLNGANA